MNREQGMAQNSPRFSRRFLTILILLCIAAILILSRTGPDDSVPETPRPQNESSASSLQE